MSDEPIHPSQFTEETDPAPDTIVWGVTDPDGTPADVRIPVSSLGGDGGGGGGTAMPHGVRVRNPGTALSGTKSSLSARIVNLGADDFTVQIKGCWWEDNGNKPGLISLTSDPTAPQAAGSLHLFKDGTELNLLRQGPSGLNVTRYSIGNTEIVDYDIVLVRDAEDAEVYVLYLDGQRLAIMDDWDEGTPPALASPLDTTHLALYVEDIYWGSSNRRMTALYEASYAYGVGLSAAEVSVLSIGGWQAFPEYLHTHQVAGRNAVPPGGILSYGADDATQTLPPSSGGFSLTAASGARTGGEGSYYLRCTNGSDTSQSTASWGAFVLDPGRYYQGRIWIWLKELSGHFRWRHQASNRAGVDLSEVVSTAETWEQVIIPKYQFLYTDLSGLGLSYTASGAEAISGQEVRLDDAEIIPLGLAGHWVFHRGPSRQAHDRTLGNEPMIFHDPSLEWYARAPSGTRTETYRFAHDEISATAGTTQVLLLPPRCGVLEVELDRTEDFDASVTADLGVSGEQDRFVDGAALDATGPLVVESLNKATQDNREHTAIYIKKSGATTEGEVLVRITYRIRG